MKTVAVIGTGISGMAAAYLLHRQYDITVYEQQPSIGGHTRTLTINYQGTPIAVDTGFIVYNEKNYPHLTAMFKHLNVPVQKSNMSFGVSAYQGSLEWSATLPYGLFGQKRNLVNPTFYRFLYDVLLFNRNAKRLAHQYPEDTLGDLLKRLRLGEWFAEFYILPMGGAIWSCPLSVMLSFPARDFVDFFDAHGLLSVINQPQWHTVTGGAKEYIGRLTASFKDRIHTRRGVSSIIRNEASCAVTDTSGEEKHYDHVIVATHADQALRMLTDATEQEKKLLGTFRYQPNQAVLHRDSTTMPTRRACWASWIYHTDHHASKEHIAVTYWMNQLQGIDATKPLFVTLNPLRPISPEYVFDTHHFDHPVYTLESAAAKAMLPTLQGVRNTWFCGAYHHNGFHEDGLRSAVTIAKQLGAEIPWAA